MHEKGAERVVGSLKRGYDRRRAQVQKLFFTIDSAISVQSLENCIIASLKSHPQSETQVCNDQSANQQKFIDVVPVGGDLAMGKKVFIKGRRLMKRKWNVLCASIRGGKQVCQRPVSNFFNLVYYLILSFEQHGIFRSL